MKIKNSKDPTIHVEGKGLKIAFILPHFNGMLVLELFENTKATLQRHNVKANNISVYHTMGSLELPYAAMKIAQKKKVDCIIALGIIIKGETDHYEHVCETTYSGLLQAQMMSKVPIIFGILTCANEKQANERVSKNGLNKGKEIAQAALLQTKLT